MQIYIYKKMIILKLHSKDQEIELIKWICFQLSPQDWSSVLKVWYVTGRQTSKSKRPISRHTVQLDGNKQ